MDGTADGTGVIAGDATNGLDVDVTRVSGTVTVDGSGVTQPVSDAGGSLTVDNGGTFAVQADSVIPGTGATNLGKAVDSAAGATDTGVVGLAIRDDSLTTLTPADGDYVPLRVSSTGALHVTGSSGSTQYAEDAAHNSGDTGTMALGVRNDNLAALAGTDGDYSPLQVNAEGALYSTLASYQSSGNTSTTPLSSSATFTGTGEVNEYPDVMVSCQTDNTGTLYFDFSVDGTNWSTFPVNGFSIAANTHEFHTASKGPRYFRVRLVNDAGAQSYLRLYTYFGNFSKLPNAPLNQTIASDADAIITNSVIAAYNGSAYTNVQATAGGNLKVSLQEASDGLDIGAGNAGTETIRVSVSTDDVNLSAIKTSVETLDNAIAGSEMQVDVVGSLPAGDNNIGNVDIVTLPASTNTLEVVGDVAHDAAAAGNPVAIAARATNSIEGLTQVAAADASFITSDLNGVIVTRPHTTLEEIISERVSNTNGTSTNFTNFAAGGAGIHNYVTTISIYNSSATDGYVDFRDGSAGSVIFTAAAPAAGGSVINLPVPLKGAANTALAYDVSAALSTVYISVVGFQAQG